MLCSGSGRMIELQTGPRHVTVTDNPESCLGCCCWPYRRRRCLRDSLSVDSVREMLDTAQLPQPATQWPGGDLVNRLYDVPAILRGLVSFILQSNCPATLLVPWIHTSPA